MRERSITVVLGLIIATAVLVATSVLFDNIKVTYRTPIILKFQTPVIRELFIISFTLSAGFGSNSSRQIAQLLLMSQRQGISPCLTRQFKWGHVFVIGYLKLLIVFH